MRGQPYSFRQEYLGEVGSMKMPEADRVALYYHIICEMFDRAVCGYRDPEGDAHPTTMQEYVAINRHALEVRRQLLAAHPALTEESFMAAIQEYVGHYSTDGMIDLLRRESAE